MHRCQEQQDLDCPHSDLSAGLSCPIKNVLEKQESSSLGANV